MRHGKAGFKLGRVTAHRWALFRNLLVALFRHERIKALFHYRVYRRGRSTMVKGEKKRTLLLWQRV